MSSTNDDPANDLRDLSKRGPGAYWLIRTTFFIAYILAYPWLASITSYKKKGHRAPWAFFIAFE